MAQRRDDLRQVRTWSGAPFLAALLTTLVNYHAFSQEAPIIPPLTLRFAQGSTSPTGGAALSLKGPGAIADDSRADALKNALGAKLSKAAPPIEPPARTTTISRADPGAPPAQQSLSGALPAAQGGPVQGIAPQGGAVPSGAITAPDGGATGPQSQPALLAAAPQGQGGASLPAIQGVSAKDVEFGMIGPLTGSAKDLGHNMSIGLETAFDVANDAGGVNGRALKLAVADDGYEPSRTPEAENKLYNDDKIFGFAGNVGTPTALVSLPFALQHQMLFFGALTGAAIIRRDPPDRYVFNFRPGYAEETEATVRFLMTVKRLRPEQIAVFAQQDAFGDSGYAGVEKAIRHINPNLNSTVMRMNYTRNTIDVAQAVQQFRARHRTIKAVIMVATYRAAARFIEKTRDLAPDLIYTNVSFVGSTSLADELMLLGPKYAAGVIVTQVVPPVDGFATSILDYRKALAKYFPGEKPDYISFEGYIDGKLLVEGIKRAGPLLTTDTLVDALEGMHKIDLGLGNVMGFSATEHQASHKIWGTVLDASGHYQPLDLE